MVKVITVHDKYCLLSGYLRTGCRSFIRLFCVFYACAFHFDSSPPSVKTDVVLKDHLYSIDPSTLLRFTRFFIFLSSLNNNILQAVSVFLMV